MSERPHEILLLEDDPVQTMMVSSALNGAMARVTCTDTVTEALRIMRGRSVDLCLVDLGVYQDRNDYADHAGLAFIHAVRNDINRSAPIIVMTVEDDPSVLMPCFDAGADDYVLKAEGLDKLVAHVGRWTSRIPLEPMDLFLARKRVIDFLVDTAGSKGRTLESVA